MMKKNNLDEMQEQKLLHIERNGCWFCFWGLLVSIIVQLLIFGPENIKALAGEWIIFMCLALYISISCMKHGIWSRSLKPSLATIFIASIIAAIVVGIIFFAVSYLSYSNLFGAALLGIFSALFTFVACSVALILASEIYKKRLADLEKEEV